MKICSNLNLEFKMIHSNNLANETVGKRKWKGKDNILIYNLINKAFKNI